MIAEHPSRDIIGTHSRDIAGKKIILCITGSVAAVRSADIARLLMRHGAEVIPVMTESARQIIHPDLMEWATGNKTIVKLSGKIEHVALAGNVKDKADLIIVAPATANTIGKIACGIDDTPVTTMVTTGLGEGIPLIIVPAMHESMYRHPFVIENIDKLKKQGITLLMPRLEEGKAKIAENEEILETAKSILIKNKLLENKKVLITAGRTVEYLDPVRVLTNNSTGKMGMALACKALSAGAEVTVVYGKGTVTPPRRARVLPAETAENMRDAVFDELKNSGYDVFIAAAAVGDWRPKRQYPEKISSHTHKSITVELEPTPKIIDGVKKISVKTFLVAFRALYNLSRNELIENAYGRLLKANADLIAVNDVSIKGAPWGAPSFSRRSV